VIGYSLSLICLVTFTLAGVELNKHGYLYSVASGLAAIYVFAGLTPRIFKHVKTIGHLYPQTAQGAGEQAQAIRKGLQNGTLQSAKLHDLSRRTKALFLLRLLGIVLILLGVVALRLLAPSPT